VLHLVLKLNNSGFGSLFNPRGVELILDSGTDIYVADVNADPRRWEAGDNQTLDKYFRIPADIPEGYYSVRLNLPDPANSLHDNPLYSIRLANDSVWDETTGYNTLRDDLHIYAGAAGDASSEAIFYELENIFSLRGNVSGQKSANMEIKLYKILGCELKTYLKSTYTDSSGGYAFEDLPEGEYYIEPVCATCTIYPQHYDLIMVPQYVPASYDFTSAPAGCQ